MLKKTFLVLGPSALFFTGASMAFADQSITNPLGNVTICQLLTNVLNAAMIIGAPIAVLFVVFAGAKYIFARGNPGELEKAHKNFMYTLVGIAIFFGAIVITQVIFNTVKQFNTSASWQSC